MNCPAFLFPGKFSPRIRTVDIIHLGYQFSAANVFQLRREQGHRGSTTFSAQSRRKDSTYRFIHYPAMTQPDIHHAIMPRDIPHARKEHQNIARGMSITRPVPPNNKAVCSKNDLRV